MRVKLRQGKEAVSDEGEAQRRSCAIRLRRNYACDGGRKGSMRSEKGIEVRRKYHRDRRAKLKAQGRCRECRAKCEKSLCAECMADKVRRQRAARPESAVDRMMELAGRMR